MAAHPHQTRSARRNARLLTDQPEDNAMSFDVIQSGPTRTTSTLTPTTLRNIEETFLELPETVANTQLPHQAGFVPPFIPFQAPVVVQSQLHQQQQQQHNVLIMENSRDNNSREDYEDEDDDDDIPLARQQGMMGGGNSSNMGNDMDDSMCSDSMSNGSWPSEKTTTSTPPLVGALSSGSKSTKTPARRGGRRPNKPSNISPEEEEKRSLRRERNKMAAARCRKRRVDHTNELTTEVDGLEKKKQLLQNDIKQLQIKKEELQFLLEAHRDHCRLFARASSPPDVKPVLTQQLLTFADKHIKIEPREYDSETPPLNTDSPNTDSMLLHSNPLMSSSASKQTPTPTSSSVMGMPGLMMKPNRPSSLAVPFTLTPSQALAGVRSSDFSGIPISTPSTGIFNFDSLMDGGTGLTPVSGPLVPTSTGHAPTQRNPMELVTPTSEPSKLVSL